MAKRPVFIAEPGIGVAYKTIMVDFPWFGGFARVQKEKCVKSLHDAYREGHRGQKVLEISNYSSLPYTAYCGRNYAKENLFGIDAPFVLRVLIHADPKLNAALIDVEIAGCHTMATLRGDFAVRSAEASGSGPKRFAAIK